MPLPTAKAVKFITLIEYSDGTSKLGEIDLNGKDSNVHAIILDKIGASFLKSDLHKKCKKELKRKPSKDPKDTMYSMVLIEQTEESSKVSFRGLCNGLKH